MPLDNISFSDFKLDTATGMTIKDARNVSLHNVIINAAKGSPITADRTTGLELDLRQHHANQCSAAAGIG